MCPRLAASFAALGLLALPGCRTSGLAFTKDRGLHIVAPAENALVLLPLHVRWSGPGTEHRFAVFFDRAPMAPGRSLLSLVAGSDPCRTQSVCPDASWLSSHDIYVAAGTSLTVDSLLDLRKGHRSTDSHEATIVPVDAAGRRIGETAFIRNFVVERTP